jgi:hypothetical protein
MADADETLERLAEIAAAAAPPLTIDQIDELRALLAPAIRAIRASAEVVPSSTADVAKPARAA